jgi:hypothetical protein
VASDCAERRHPIRKTFRCCSLCTVGAPWNTVREHGWQAQSTAFGKRTGHAFVGQAASAGQSGKGEEGLAPAERDMDAVERVDVRVFEPNGNPGRRVRMRGLQSGTPGAGAARSGREVWSAVRVARFHGTDAAERRCASLELRVVSLE